MLKNLKLESGKLKLALEHITQQFLQCAKDSAIINEDEVVQAEKMIIDFWHRLEFVDDDNNLGSVLPNKNTINLKSKYLAQIENATHFDDVELEGLKKVLFHELLHILQISRGDTRADNYIGYQEPLAGTPRTGMNGSVQSNCLTEAAASLGTELMWIHYLKNIKGAKEAGPVEHNFKVLNRPYIVPVAVENPDEYINTDYKAGKFIWPSYPDEVSIAKHITKALGMKTSTFVRGSTVFGKDIKNEMPEKFEEATGHFSYVHALDACDEFFDFREKHNVTGVNKLWPSQEIAEEFFKLYESAIFDVSLENEITASSHNAADDLSVK
jgi:hypothetical protein